MTACSCCRQLSADSESFSAELYPVLITHNVTKSHLRGCGWWWWWRCCSHAINWFLLLLAAETATQRWTDLLPMFVITNLLCLRRFASADIDHLISFIGTVSIMDYCRPIITAVSLEDQQWNKLTPNANISYSPNRYSSLAIWPDLIVHIYACYTRRLNKICHVHGCDVFLTAMQFTKLTGRR